MVGIILSCISVARRRGFRVGRLARRASPLGWAAMALCTAAIISIPSSAQAQWAVGQVRIVGTGLTVSPSRQTIQVGVPTVINTSFGGSAVPLGYVVRAELSGPAYAEDQALSTVPNSPF